MSLASDQKNDDFKKPTNALIFKTLDDMAQNLLATDKKSIFTSFKAKRFNQIRQSLANLKTLENLTIACKPLQEAQKQQLDQY